MAAGSASVDTMLADAISKMDAMTKRLDALETGTGHKNPIKGDAAKKADAKKADDDDDDKKDDAVKTLKNKICDDDDDDKKDDSAKKSDDDDDDKKDDAFPPKKKAAKDDDGELEIKHEPEDKKADKRKDSKKADAKKADSKKADAKKADDDDDDDRRDDDDDDDKKGDSKKADDDDDDDKKDDAAKADSVALRRMIQDQAATIRRLESLMKPKSDDEHAAFADAQARADAVFNGFGQRAPRPLEGETLIDYRKRLATKLKSYSPVWKSVKFSQLPEEAFGIAEGQVYADATAAATNPTDLEAGELRQVTKTDPTTGVRTIVFYGKDCFVKQMGRPGRRVQSFRTLASQ